MFSFFTKVCQSLQIKYKLNTVQHTNILQWQYGLFLRRLDSMKLRTQVPQICNLGRSYGTTQLESTVQYSAVVTTVPADMLLKMVGEQVTLCFILTNPLLE